MVTGEFKEYQAVGGDTCASSGVHQIGEDREGFLFAALVHFFLNRILPGITNEHECPFI